MNQVLLLLGVSVCVWGLTPRDLSVAERLARYCHASYCDQAQVMQWDCLFCDSSAQQAKPLFFSRNESTHSTFFILKNDEFKEIVVAFRGTKMRDIKEWAKNVQFLKNDLYNYMPWFEVNSVQIHSGFGDMYLSNREMMIKELQNAVALYPDYQVRVTGHSLGGALATIAAMDIHDNLGIENVHTITFASPRVGNHDFAQQWNDRLAESSMRFVHENDIVPHIPFPQLGYEHVGYEMWETQGEVKACSVISEDFSCSWAIPSDEWRVQDHFTYLNVQLHGCNAFNESSVLEY